MKVVFFGTPAFAADILQELFRARVDVVAVVTQPDRPKGRSGRLQAPAVKLLCQEQAPSLPIHQPQKASDENFCDVLEAYQADLFIVVAYGEILRQRVLDLPSLACINVHGSLLPLYRGAAPVHHCILAGDSETGVTIMHMVRKMDAGAIIKQEKIAIADEMTYGELEKALRVVGAQALLSVIKDFNSGPVPEVAQDESLVTFAPKVDREMAELDWKLPAKALHRKIRGLSPTPAAWCFVTVREEKKRLKIFQATLSARKAEAPGSFFVEDGALFISCGDGSLELLDLQLEGKKRLLISDFLRGVDVQQIKFLPA